tara:strand:+ start:518 stop:634 length:117 start_codon:yes stop_codon:yes gene_type:complete
LIDEHKQLLSFFSGSIVDFELCLNLAVESFDELALILA